MTVTAQDGTRITPPAAGPGSGNGIFNLYNGAKGYANATNTLAGGGCDNVTGATGGAGVFAGFVGGGGTTPCAQNLFETPSNFAPEWQLAGRADWNIGPNDRAYVRMQYDVGTQPTNTDPLNPLFNTQSY